ncbi:MAG: hypothetical protein AMXMBFR53_36230 [Gemmatimonadota bacterium]
MTPRPSRVVLLGPQRGDPDVGRVLADLGSPGPVALVTAGWQEWEEDDARLRGALGPGAFNLRLYGRAEEVWRDDPELADAHRTLQEHVRLLRRAYNVRLAHAMDAWIELLGVPGDAAVLDAEQASALEAVRELDRHHARRLAALREAFYHRYDPLMRAAVGRRRDEVARALAATPVVVVAGGHVPALLNRLRLFGVDRLLEGKTVIATGGGAMAMAPRVVLFHDSPPWGPGHAEMGEVGLGLYPGVVALPDAAARLRLDDPGRVSRLARRFEPDACVLLDPGARVAWEGRWRARGARRLTTSGRVEGWDAA